MQKQNYPLILLAYRALSFISCMKSGEIAHSIGLSKRGMESIRYRMHKKLGLGKHQSIKTYLAELPIL